MAKKPTNPEVKAQVLDTVHIVDRRRMMPTAKVVADHHPTPMPEKVMARILKELAADGQLVRQGKSFMPLRHEEQTRAS